MCGTECWSTAKEAETNSVVMETKMQRLRYVSGDECSRGNSRSETLGNDMICPPSPACVYALYTLRRA